MAVAREDGFLLNAEAGNTMGPHGKYGAYAKRLKAAIMSLTMGVRAYGKAWSTP